MKQICIMVFLFLFFSQVAYGYTVKSLRQMCKSRCQSVTLNKKDLSSEIQKIVCREFTKACRILQRIDSENRRGDLEADYRRHPATKIKRNRKVAYSQRKGRKADNSKGGMAVSAVGNAVAMASNGHKTVLVNGHNRPQVASFGSGEAFATDGKISEYSSHGLRHGKAKYLSTGDKNFEKSLKKKYGHIDEVGSSEESDEGYTSSKVSKEDSYEDENSREQTRAHSDKEGEEDFDGSVSSDFSKQLQKQHEMFRKKIEDQNANIMKGIMNQLGM